MAGGIFSGSSNSSGAAASDAAVSAQRAEEFAREAEEWAVGPDPDDSTPGEENNAQYWAEQAALNAETYSAGDGIDISALNVISVEDDGVTTAKIADNSVDIAKLNVTDGTNGQVLSTDGSGNLSFIDEVTDGTLSDLSDTTITNPTEDQFLRYDANNGHWINESVALGHGITAGTGLNLTNNVIGVTALGIDTPSLAVGSVTTAKLDDNAVNADKLSVDGTDGQLLSTNSDGDLEWVTPAAGTAYTASDGITLAADDFSLTDGGVVTAKLADDAVDADKLNVTGNGTSGQILSSDGDGSFTWIDEGAADAYTAGTGLDLNGQEFSISDGGVDSTQIAGDAVDGSKLDATNTPTAGQFLTANLDNSFTWVTPAAGTAYTAGTGLDLTGDEFSIADDGVDTAQIADNAVDADKLNVTGDGTSGQFLASDGDGSFTWTASTNSLEGLTDTNIPAGGPSVRSFLEYNTTDDTWDATAATEFLNISELFDVDITNVQNNQFLRYNTTDDRWENESVTIPANLTFTAPLSRSGTTVTLPDGSIDVDLLADNAVDADKLSVSGTSGQILSTDSDGDLAWIDADGNTAYTAGTGLTLTSDEFSVTPNGITNALLANNSVRTENIADGTITGADMADGTVGNTQIADDAVTAAKIADNTITAAQVASNSLGATELATDSVSSFKLQDDAVISGKIANNVVGADELNVAGDGTGGQILASDGDGTFSWVDNAAGSEYTAGTGLTLSADDEFSVPDDGITSALIATNAVGTDQIANDAVTGTQLAALSVDTPELTDSAVETAKINDAAVTTAKINDAAVTNGKLGDGAVNTSKIFDGAITAAKLGSGSVTTVKIGDLQVTNAKVATDIPLTKLMDVNTAGALNGQVLTYDGTNWLPMTPSGGGNTDNSRLGIALDVTSLNEGDPAETVSITLSIVDGLTDETISGQSVTVTDPTGHTINVDGSGNAFTFSASGMNVGNYVIRASATFTISGNTSVHTSSATLRVIETPADNINWYQSVSDTEPTAIGDMTDNGVFNSPETGDWTRPAADTDLSDMAYVALPTGTYTFHAGLLFATITDLGAISTDYTLYRLDDFAQVSAGGTRTITITEA